MTITVTLDKNTRRFEDVNCGDVFKYEDDYYMKVYIPKNMNNAVNLASGEVIFFHYDRFVTLVDHELVIK